MDDTTRELVRARRIEVVDDTGTPRIVLTVVVDAGGNDIALVTLHDPAGAQHVSLSCDAEAAAIELVEGGNGVASLASNRAGSVFFVLPDEG